MSSNSVVQEKTFQTADELLHALSPRGSFFGKEYEPSRWIFRGHGDAEWTLLPKILRTEKGPLWLFLDKRPDDPRPGRWHTVDYLSLSGDTLMIAEIDTLMRFVNIADQNGLAVPEDSVVRRKELRELRDKVVRSARSMDKDSDEQMLSWPSETTQSLMALAQHYGIPTRLLDWTYSSYTAAYFAAADSVERSARDPLVLHLGPLAERLREKEIDQLRDLNHHLRIERTPDEDLRISETQSQYLSVWALSLVFLESDQTKNIVELVSVPTAGNPNLYAQRGAFTLSRKSVEPDHSDINRIDRTPLEKVIETEGDKRSFDEPVMFHMKIPRREASVLLRLLSKEGFDRARLFPGYSGVAKALLEQSLWDGNRG